MLRARIASNSARLVYIDADGTLHDWMVVVVRHATGVIYGTQCDGHACDQRFVEGYAVPVGGKYDTDMEGERISSKQLTAPFHDGGHWNAFFNMPEAMLASLKVAVRQIPFWKHNSEDDCSRGRLEIDMDRLHEICEAWVPVRTPDGLGVLLWPNCD
ncbi:MAG: DUF6210 family protein [Planctomycetota bacterium]|nr:DUF6210 family protein [Planctomycetota bacterium]